MAVVAVFIFIMLELFVFPYQNPYDEFASTALNAISDPGRAQTLKFSFSKGFVFNNLTLSSHSVLKKYPEILFSFKVADSLQDKFEIKYNVDAENNYIINAKIKSSIYKQNATIICHPYIAFVNSTKTTSDDFTTNLALERYIFFCEIIFGRASDKDIVAHVSNKVRSADLGNYDKIITIDSLPAGITEDNLILRTFVLEYTYDIDNLTEQIYFIRPNNFGTKLKYSDVSSINNGVGHVTVPFEFTGHYLILYELMSRNILSDWVQNDIVIGPAFYDFEYIDVNKTYTDYLQECKTIKKEIGYKDLQNNRCVYYYGCEECALPSLCADVWQSKEESVLQDTKEHAIGYGAIEECN